MSIYSTIQKSLNPLRRALKSVLARGVIHKYSNGFVQASFLADETRDKVKVYQHYGFSSHPPKNTKCVAVCNGSRDGLVVVGEISTEKPKLEEGDAALFNGKSQIHLKGEKILIKNSTIELIDWLSQFIDLLAKTTIPTALGPQPLSTKMQLEQLKIQIDKLKG